MPGALVAARAGRRYVRARRSLTYRRKYRKSLARTTGRSRGRRGLSMPNFSFHRWVQFLPAYVTGTAGSGVRSDGLAGSYDATTGLLTNGTTVAQKEWAFSASFALNDLQNVSEFTALFDQFKLNAILLQFKLVGVPENGAAPNANTSNYGNFYPTIWLAPDMDDQNLIGVSALKEYQKVRHKVLRPNKEVGFLLRPRPLIQQYGTLTTTSYALQSKAPWIDIATGTGGQTPHYGVKWAIDFEGLTLANVAAGGFQIKVNAKYYFQTKNVR